MPPPNAKARVAAPTTTGAETKTTLPSDDTTKGRAAASRASIRERIRTAPNSDALVESVPPMIAAASLGPGALGPADESLLLAEMESRHKDLAGYRIGLKPLRDTVEDWRKRIAVTGGSGSIVEADESPNSVKQKAAWLRQNSAYRFGRDRFTGQDMIAPRGSNDWRPITDTDFIYVRIEMEGAGFSTFGGRNDLLKQAIAVLIAENEFDSAQDWLAGQIWDGVPRVENFAEAYLGVAVSAYDIPERAP